MQNTNAWSPTKYVFRNGKLRASRNSSHVSVSSRLMTDITASFYQRAVPEHVRGRLADLGCGNVPFFELYRPYITTSTCVDWPNSLHRNQYLDVEADLNAKLPLPDQEFDTIILSEVLEHIAEPELLWSEMSRILVKNGKILLSVPFLYKIHEAPHDYYRYTEFALRRFAEKNQLTVLELKAFGGLPEVFADILAKRFVGLPLIGKMLAAFVQSCCSVFVRTKWGQRISTKSARDFPLGYFMVLQK